MATADHGFTPIRVKGNDIYPFRARAVDPEKPVEVYRNLHLGLKSLPIYSLRQGGVVVGHTSRVWLRDAEFIVQETGRQRVLATGRKNVHAWVRGHLLNPAADGRVYGWAVQYNPRRYALFNVDGKRAVFFAKAVRVDAQGITASEIS